MPPLASIPVTTGSRTKSTLMKISIFGGYIIVGELSHGGSNVRGKM
jgi:hypothetical protein